MRRVPGRAARIRVRDFRNPVPDLRRALLAAYPHAGIRAVGLGRRHSERRHRVLREIVVKVVVADKHGPVAPGNRIPRTLAIEGAIWGRPVRLRLPTDIVQDAPAALTSFRLGDPSEGVLLTATCYAVWHEPDGAHGGCLTAGHGLWTAPGSGLLRPAIAVELPPRVPGRPRWASDLRTHGVDIGLVEFPRAELPPAAASGLVDLLPAALDLPSAGTLLAQLGSEADAALLPVEVLTSLQECPDVVAVAYYDERRLELDPGWGTVLYREVVESHGPEGTFIGGTSGSSLVSQQERRAALALQSACLDPSLGRRSVGTGLSHGLAVLRTETGWDVQASWQAAAIRRVLCGA